jgi:hypothetical protein
MCSVIESAERMGAKDAGHGSRRGILPLACQAVVLHILLQAKVQNTTFNTVMAGYNTLVFKDKVVLFVGHVVASPHAHSTTIFRTSTKKTAIMRRLYWQFF